jgi:hypothetical protein
MANASDTWIIKKIRACMAVRGLQNNVVNVSRMFRDLDLDGSGTLDFGEFKAGINEVIGMQLSYEELQMCFALFDENGDGEISYEELMTAILPPIAPIRRMFIDAVWAEFRPDPTTGAVKASEIYNNIDMQYHPLCVRGTLTKQEAFCRFLSTFESGEHEEEGHEPGSVYFREFNNYCSLISADAITNNEFGMVITRVFGLCNSREVVDRVHKEYCLISEASIEEQRRRGGSGGNPHAQPGSYGRKAHNIAAPGPKQWAPVVKPAQGFQGAVHNMLYQRSGRSLI